MSTRRKLGLALVLLAVALVACSNPRAWYRIDDYPSFTLHPVLDFEQPIDAPTNGAPPRMLKLNKELNVGWKEWTHNRHPTHEGKAAKGFRCECSKL